ncbi:hypothetical protein TcCL_Unassigned03483 [Trypanosoma cruzi]|nr:hypothetical protein TcCL_Unassigned03483 [Trypanosoma cruzi]
MCPSTTQVVRTLVDDVCIAPATKQKNPQGKYCRLLNSPGNTGYGHNPAANAHGASNLPSTHTRKRSPHPPTTRRLSPCGHTECTFSSIEIIRRPSLKDASVDDGP